MYLKYILLYLCIPNQQMSKKYLYIVPLFFLTSLCAKAQDSKDNYTSRDISILNDYMDVFPNPVGTGGRLYISSKKQTPKDFKIFDVLGKLVLIGTANTKEINISSLTSGVYIIKLSDENQSASRKLVIK